MKPGYYTELFFLDETTALAAGHRPCAECRREAWRRFASCWAEGAGSSAPVRVADLDLSLHLARVDRRRGKITFQARFGDFPDGTIFMSEEATFLKWKGTARPWSLEGYGPEREFPPEREVIALTPRPTVEAMKAGYVPDVHATAGEGPHPAR